LSFEFELCLILNIAVRMGKHKKDKVGKALRDNPMTSARSTLADQIHSDRFVEPEEEQGSNDEALEQSTDPEVFLSSDFVFHQHGWLAFSVFKLS